MGTGRRRSVGRGRGSKAEEGGKGKRNLLCFGCKEGSKVLFVFEACICIKCYLGKRVRVRSESKGQ